MLSHKGTLPIETSRLLLRRMRADDAEGMFARWASDPEVTRFLRWQPHASAQVTKDLLTAWETHYDDPEYYHWGITLKDSGDIIGSFSVFSVNSHDQAGEVGYCIGRDFWGKGYTAEALEAVIHFMIYEVKLNRLEAYHAVGNFASGAVMRKAGMVYEGHVRQKYLSASGFQDCELYGIIKDDLFPVSLWQGFAGDMDILCDGELELISLAHKPAIPEKGWVPSYAFEIQVNGQKAGEINLRIGMTDALYYGGHIGYAVEPEFRGHGFVVKACLLLTPLIRFHGMKRVIITNDCDNFPSRRTCEKLGARLIRIADVPEGHELYLMGQRRKNIFVWDVT